MRLKRQKETRECTSDCMEAGTKRKEKRLKRKNREIEARCQRNRSNSEEKEVEKRAGIKEDRIGQRDFYARQAERERRVRKETNPRAGAVLICSRKLLTLTFAPRPESCLPSSSFAPFRPWSQHTNACRRRNCSTGIDYDPGLVENLL